MAFTSRFAARARAGPQRPKVGGDENAVVNTTKHVKHASITGVTRSKFGPQRPALGEVTATAVNKQVAKVAGKAALKEEAGLKRNRSASLAAASGIQRVPLGPVRTNNATSTTTASNSTTVAQPTKRAQRPPLGTIRQSETAPELSKAAPKPAVIVEDVAPEADDSMDIVEQEVVAEVAQSTRSSKSSPVEPPVENREVDEDHVAVSQIWPALTPRAAEKYKREIEHIQKTFHDELDMFDTTMVHEYAEDIFDYMSDLELTMMANPEYMLGQNEISWDMRQTLVDWLLQVHLRYHLLPETLWIAINIVDRFLTKRVVSVVKLQLVGVTAMFIAAKFEEILAPSVDEFVFMTEGGYTKDEILKGERIMLQTLDFKVSDYCSPYSWMRRISKADDYDIQTRTLCKYLVEVTLLDNRFLRVKPSMVAAIGMYTARRMLGNDWNDAFVFYSGFTEEHLLTGHYLVMEKLNEIGFDRLYVSRKYANKKFLKASIFAIEWARANIKSISQAGEEMILEP